MYRAHFGLEQTPFGITPNPAFFYSGNTRGAILDALLYAVMHGEGIVKVTGEVGSGKTMLCRMLESQLPDNVVVIYLVNPSLTPEEVLFTIAGELNLDISNKRSDELLRLLHADLIAKHVAGQQVVLLVEEAQAMPLETLEEIRLLTNLETAHHKLLQIVLFGQPELDANLSLLRMRQLRERITHSFTVPPMEADVIGEYLAFRLAAAGYRGAPLFSDEAVGLIATVSQGIVRRINILADKALLSAFADDAATVAGKHVRAAVSDSPFGRLPRRAPRQGTAIAVVVVLLVAALVWQLLQWTPQSSNAVATLAAGIPLPRMPAPPAYRAPPAPLPPATPAETPSTPPTTSMPSMASTPALPANSTQAAERVAPDSLLGASLLATAPWLRQAPAHHFVLQIAVLPYDDKRRIAAFLHETQAAIGLEKIHVYRFSDGGKPSLAIVYGSFSSRASAEAVRELLSDQSAYRPQVLDIASIRRQASAAEPATP